ncbi:MAG: glucans biosynthesis glucosyltransferase MdoH [Oxalicibacterium faecigallinarum]|uniref:glucans biosynthesis glucosyltransferase MdoH n=1 Tax=Oxalicibacterium faecigallinarum TaxID=573741 RepID=UPI0028097C1E|nr:glucans biosynthesis glucosyltransferase MdoH [Oxalicibacterium faecigallinarum]MDQ7968882.1 glucans biosynthesis glucosyltransferase MdoH [Oxalicibacterium faecigallinarum]
MTTSRLPSSCLQYLDLLKLPAPARKQIESQLLARMNASSSDHEAMIALHAILAGHETSPDQAAQASIRARAQLAVDQDATWCDETGAVVPDAAQAASLYVAPPINRASMVPHPWGALNPLVRWWQSRFHREEAAAEEAEAAPDADVPVASKDTGGSRRIVLLLLMLGQTAMATYYMSRVLPYQGSEPLEMAILALFALLFCWVSAGFWTAMTGFLLLARGKDPFLITRNVKTGAPIDAGARTAIVMPICNEDVTRVFAGLRATYESVARTGQLDRFDFYVLSDTNGSDTCAAEVAAWTQLCNAVDGFGRLFYRRRQRRVRRKSGNIDDFCRRWGNNYRYMVVLDADSVMSGDCLTKMVQAMEQNPDAGIIQTAPRAAGRDTLYARIQQFSTRVYGPLFTAGLHYWQLGESHYWGHNAIIRMAPFIRHCGLALLPGKGTFSGEILSHDFIEAALMRRAGWKVWIAYDLDGSYEEMPPNLLDELKRDRRWCQGNLMNFRLFMSRGMHSVHRAVFVTGVLAYLSAPLWFLFLILSTGLLAQHTLVEPTYFTEPWQLFPTWPQWHPEKAMALFSATVTLLFLPKVLSVFLICFQGAKHFGGRVKLFFSMLIEMLFSMLLAPVRMLFHTHFVIAAFMGWALRWKSPPREDTETTPGEAFRHHGFHTLLGLAWGGAVFWLNPTFLPWLLPIVGSLVIAIPVSIYSSKVSNGLRFRRAGLFLIPEEDVPPVELTETVRYVKETPLQPDFIQAVVEPQLNGLMCATGKYHPRRSLRARKICDDMVHTALIKGPAGLPDAQKNKLLADPVSLSQLHLAVWTSKEAHPHWFRDLLPPDRLEEAQRQLRHAA